MQNCSIVKYSPLLGPSGFDSVEQTRMELFQELLYADLNVSSFHPETYAYRVKSITVSQ